MATSGTGKRKAQAAVTQAMSGGNVIWELMCGVPGSNEWRALPAAAQVETEKVYTQLKPGPHTLTTGHQPGTYSVDPLLRVQTNTRTQYRRPLRRRVIQTDAQLAALVEWTFWDGQQLCALGTNQSIELELTVEDVFPCHFDSFEQHPFRFIVSKTNMTLTDSSTQRIFPLQKSQTSIQKHAVEQPMPEIGRGGSQAVSAVSATRARGNAQPSTAATSSGGAFTGLLQGGFSQLARFAGLGGLSGAFGGAQSPPVSGSSSPGGLVSVKAVSVQPSAGTGRAPRLQPSPPTSVPSSRQKTFNRRRRGSDGRDFLFRVELTDSDHDDSQAFQGPGAPSNALETLACFGVCYTVIDGDVSSEDAGACADCPICLDALEPSSDPDTTPIALECKHVFHSGCVTPAISAGSLVCPLCSKAFGRPQTGLQPNGTMTARIQRGALSGFDAPDHITIEYNMPSGIQGPKHPHPGSRYQGTSRTAYLPDTPRGHILLELFKIAFERRLIFTVGESLTLGPGSGIRVVWATIHHKTSFHGTFGYPDPTYFDRVTDELRAVGVTEA
eukprot:m.11441 g.11441  ORF g.11441 m.11441 type:complete len:555 (-) comp5722_c0_seq1:88-1752(-)